MADRLRVRQVTENVSQGIEAKLLGVPLLRRYSQATGVEDLDVDYQGPTSRIQVESGDYTRPGLIEGLLGWGGADTWWSCKKPGGQEIHTKIDVDGNGDGLLVQSPVFTGVGGRLMIFANHGHPHIEGVVAVTKGSKTEMRASHGCSSNIRIQIVDD